MPAISEYLKVSSSESIITLAFITRIEANALSWRCRWVLYEVCC